jgi:integrase/recombinase XerC
MSLLPLERTRLGWQFFEETLDGYAAQRRSAGNQDRSILGELAIVRRFARTFGAPPHHADRSHVDGYFAGLARVFAPSTLRAHQYTMRRYFNYVTDPAYDWGRRCEEQFGIRLTQLCVPENTLKHAWRSEVGPGRRALSAQELSCLFGVMVAGITKAEHSHRKGVLTRARNYALLQCALGYGARAREIACAEIFDFGESTEQHAKERFGPYGVFTIRHGKAVRRGRRRRRQVLAVPLFAASVDTLRWYIDEIRPRLLGEHKTTALWPTERGTMIEPTSVSDIFRDARRAAGLPKDLTLHSLRHTYITMLLEHNYPELFVQDQVGHGDAAVTAAYTTVGDDFRRRVLHEAMQGMLGQW